MNQSCETYVATAADSSWLAFLERIAERQSRLGGTLRVMWCDDRPETGSGAVPQLRGLGVTVRKVKRATGTRIAVDQSVALVDGRLVRVASDVQIVATSLRRTWQTTQLAYASEHRTVSDRGGEAVALLATGMTDAAVARQLGVSVRTVRSDVASMMQVVSAGSRFQAGVRAAQLGLV